VPPLAELQTKMRHAVVEGDGTALAPILVGGGDPQKRLAIHHRHYEASLTRALTEKFPALNWLIGSPLLLEAARAFVRRHPPSAPCIAEYGAQFPAFLAAQPVAAAMPWIGFVGELEWHVGQAALAVDHPPIAAEHLQSIAAEQLPDVNLVLQPGLRYLAAPWPVDELFRLFLCDAAPDRYALAPEQVYLEIYGVRGAFDVLRLGAGVFSFRRALRCGHTIEAAAAQAAAAEPQFDVGAAVAALITGGLVIAVRAPSERNGPCLS
jgi:hypothetical protein